MIVDLSKCRDLLDLWNAVRVQIVNGEFHGLAVCAKDARGAETVFFSGTYRDAPNAALQASLSMSWELTKRNGGMSG